VERQLLGATLLDEAYLNASIEAFSGIDGIGGSAVFYRPAHRFIYEAMCALHEAGTELNPVLIGERLKQAGASEEAGGATGVSELIYGLPRHASTNTISGFTRLIRDKHNLRRLIRTCNKITAEALDGEDDEAVILDRAEAEIFALSSETARRGLEHVRAAAERVISAAQQGGPMLTGLPTGFAELDTMTAGLQKKDLIIIAARPSMGKTSLIVQLMQNVCRTDRQAVCAFFSAEMSAEQVVMRMLCSEARVDLLRFRSGFLSRDEWGRIAAALSVLAEMKIFIDDTPAVTSFEMAAKCRRLGAEHKRIDLVAIDYMQLMGTPSGARRAESRQQEVAQNARDLKRLAKELDAPLVALSQLSRANEKRTDHEPQLSDLRESGELEQTADLVAFIHREEMYTRTPESEGRAKIIIAKQRQGPTGDFELTFLKEYTRFENMWREDGHRSSSSSTTPPPQYDDRPRGAEGPHRVSRESSPAKAETSAGNEPWRHRDGDEIDF